MTAMCFPVIPAERRFKVAKLFRHLGITPVEPHRCEAPTIRIWISNDPKPNKRRRDGDINGAMVDSSKATTAKWFQEVFGYAYDIDPETHRGIAVSKSNQNGRVHGQLVTCPSPRRCHMFYSRFLEGEEWRVQFYGHHVCVTKVYRDKWNGFPVNYRRPGSSRHNVNPLGEFTAHELALLAQLARRANMDYGGMDVIRDCDGRIYVIDLNPGPNGPHREAFPLEDWPNVIPVEAELFRKAFLP